MRVVRERPTAERAFGINAPLRVSVDGREPIAVREWSHDWIIVDAGNVRPFGKVELRLFLNFQGFEIVVPVEGFWESTEPDDGVLVRFSDVPQRSAELIQVFIEDFVRGRMTAAGDAILAMDTPIEPISTEPEPEPEPDTARPRALKPLVMNGLYAALGLGLFLYAGVLVYGNFVRLEVETAVLSRPVEVVEMPRDGQVETIAATVGAEVEQGALLVAVSDPELEATIGTAEVALQAASDALASLEERRTLYTTQLADYRLIGETERDIAKAEVSRREQALEAATLQIYRTEELVQKGHVSRKQLDTARADFAAAEAALRRARLLLKQKTALTEVAARRHYNGDAFVLDLDLVDVEIREAEAAKERAERELAVLTAQRQSQNVTAPFDGRVVDVMRVTGARLLRGAPILALEPSATPVVEAFLTQEEVLQVGIGDRADVFLPSVNLKLEGTVTRVDRTSGFIDEQRSQYRWRGVEDRSARVVLDVSGADIDALPSGLPAVTLFHRRKHDAVHALLLSAPAAGDRDGAAADGPNANAAADASGSAE